MKQKLLLGMISSGMLLLSGCGGEDFDSKGTGAGRIVPSVELDARILSSQEGSRAATDITGNDLAINLTSADGSISRNWDSVADFPLDEEFKVGEYTITASYGDNSEGFELPYYQGSATVTVKENAITPVSLTATLANAMLSIDYTDAFKNYFTAYSTDIATPGGNYIFYRPDETRPAYIKTGSVGFTVNVTKPNGTEASYKPAGFTAEARHHYHMTFDVAGEGNGTAMLVIKFDDTLNIEDIIIDLSDELQNAPAPVLTVNGAIPGEPLNFVSGMAPETPVQVSVVARGGLSSVTMTTKSTSLIEQGWPAEVELIAAPENMRARLSSLGLKPLGLWKNPDQLAVIDLTGVLGNIEFIEGNSNDIEFTFNVTDRYTKVAEPVTVSLHVEKLQLALSNPGKIYEGADLLDLDVEYNGLAPEKNIKFQVRNERNTWDDVTAESIALKSRSLSTYRATLNVPANDNALRVRAICGKTISEELTVERTPLPFTLSCNDNDVFATHATLTMTSSEADAEKYFTTAIVYISTDGTNFTGTQFKADKNGNLNLNGLVSGTTTQIKIGSKGTPVTFTTEAAIQLPNSGMEEWSQTDNGKNWERVFPGSDANSVWGTNNPLTTSQGSDYAYCRISGTISTNDAHSGSAALIRNVGWGKGNSATGSKGTSGNCKYTEVGLLHLGASRGTRPNGYSENDNKSNNSSAGPVNTDDLDCGISFASRPSSVSFWYKYSPKNSADKGNAYAWVKDASGNIIAEGNADLNSTGNYTQVTIPFNYGTSVPKGAKIYVRFMSSNSIDYVKRTDANYSGPGFANLSRGTFMGSQLYIDDIQLNY